MPLREPDDRSSSRIRSVTSSGWPTRAPPSVPVIERVSVSVPSSTSSSTIGTVTTSNPVPGAMVMLPEARR